MFRIVAWSRGGHDGFQYLGMSIGDCFVVVCSGPQMLQVCCTNQSARIPSEPCTVLLRRQPWCLNAIAAAKEEGLMK